MEWPACASADSIHSASQGRVLRPQQVDDDAAHAHPRRRTGAQAGRRDGARTREILYTLHAQRNHRSSAGPAASPQCFVAQAEPASVACQKSLRKFRDGRAQRCVRSGPRGARRPRCVWPAQRLARVLSEATVSRARRLLTASAVPGRERLTAAGSRRPARGSLSRRPPRAGAVRRQAGHPQVGKHQQNGSLWLGRLAGAQGASARAQGRAQGAARAR
jgi:hypothetical protein